MSDDWDTVTYLRKTPASGRVAKSESAINAARRTGAEIQTDKKFAAGSNKQVVASKDSAKLDRETEELHHDRVGIDTGRIIQQARNEKKLTQKELAQKINEQATTIAAYENGSAIPNNQIFSKLERVLGVRLRGKNKGEKFGAPAGSSSASGSKN